LLSKQQHFIVNSVVGHRVPYLPGISIGLYPATKFAVTATSELLRHDMKNAGKKMRVTVSKTNISGNFDFWF